MLKNFWTRNFFPYCFGLVVNIALKEHKVPTLMLLLNEVFGAALRITYIEVLLSVNWAP